MEREVYEISLSSSNDNDTDSVSSSSGSVKIIMELSTSLFNEKVPRVDSIHYYKNKISPWLGEGFYRGYRFVVTKGVTVSALFSSTC